MDDVRGVGLLGHIALHANVQHLTQIVLVVMHGEHDDAVLQIVTVARLNAALESLDLQTDDLGEIESMETASHALSISSGGLIVLTIIFW